MNQETEKNGPDRNLVEKAAPAQSEPRCKVSTAPDATFPAPISESSYQSSPHLPTFFGKLLPSFIFYLKYICTVVREGVSAYSGNYNGKKWVRGSLAVIRALEESGLVFNVEGLENIRHEDGPYVFVANHMSTLETVALPCLIRPLTPLSFVVKKSLLTYPFLGPVLMNCRPIGLERKNPRQDLQVVLEKGTELLASGTSVFIFPQSTRSPGLDARTFNSIGVKLARKAGCRVIPLALRSDAWEMGKLHKEFGRLNPSLPVHFCFGESFPVQGNGKAEQARVFDFIAAKMREWNLPVITEAGSDDG